MLCGVGVHSLLQNARHSAIRIRGFNGSRTAVQSVHEAAEPEPEPAPAPESFSMQIAKAIVSRGPKQGSAASLLTGDAGRTSLTTAFWAQADSAPTKTISAVGDVVFDHANDVEG